MSLAPPSSFFRRLVARHPPAKADDPADMGTVFGLEASLGPVSGYPGPSEDDHAAQGDESPMDWLGRRIAQRR